MAQTMYDTSPDDARTQTNPNVVGVAPMSSGWRRAPVNATTAMPPWFVTTVSLTARGRGASTTWKPSARKRRMQTASGSCHVSTTNKTSMHRSRLTSRTSSSLLFSDRMLRQPKFIHRVVVISWRCRRTVVRTRWRAVPATDWLPTGDGERFGGQLCVVVTCGGKIWLLFLMLCAYTYRRSEKCWTRWGPPS